MNELDKLATEGRRGDLGDLDLRTARELVEVMNSEDATVHQAVARAADAIAAAAEGIAKRLAHEGRLVYVGAGTAGRLGLLDAAECGPTFDAPDGQVVGILAGGVDAFHTPAEAAEDDEEAGRAEIGALGVTSADAVVGISASGRTPFVLGAIKAAGEVGALTVGVACNGGSALAALAETPIEVVTGPEVVSGSTRLKAGSAQKMVLNMLSTIAMIGLNKTYGDLMVDVRATNDKLRRRSLRIICSATGAHESDASAALSSADGEAKTAIVMLGANLSPDEARSALTRHHGSVRAVLEASR